MPRQDRLSLQTVQFNPTPFQAVTFTPQAADASILQHSLAQQEEREQKATQSLADANKVFATMRSQLHQDPRTMGRFEEWQRSKMDRLYQLRNLDPDRAFKEATLLATEVTNDAEMQGRMRNNEQISKHIKDIQDNKNINKIRKERFIKHYQEGFDSELEVDPVTGQVTGTKEWVPDDSPVEDVNLTDLVNIARQFAAPTKGSSDKFSQTGHTNSDKSSSSSFGGSSYSRTTLTEEKLDEVLEGVSKVYPQAQQSLLQKYDDNWYELDKISKQLETETNEVKRRGLVDRIAEIREEMTDENGIIRTPREYMAYCMGFIIPNMAYDYIDTGSKSGRETVDAPLTGGVGLGGLTNEEFAAFMSEFGGGTQPGSTVYMNWGDIGGGAVSGVSDAVSAVMRMLGNNGQQVDSYTRNGKTYRYSSLQGRYVEDN